MRKDKQNVAKARNVIAMPRMTGTLDGGSAKFGCTPAGGCSNGMILYASGGRLLSSAISGPLYVFLDMTNTMKTVRYEIAVFKTRGSSKDLLYHSFT